jgi:hypothetical protein
MKTHLPDPSIIRLLKATISRTHSIVSLLALLLAQLMASHAAAQTDSETCARIKFNTVTYGTEELALGSWNEPKGMETDAIMESSRMGRLFMDEFLPPLFRRTLVRDAPVKAGETITWALTGPRAGLTVKMRANRVEFIAVCYDSNALHPEPVLAGNGEASSFPEKQMSLFDGNVEGEVKSVPVVMHDEMEVELLINGVSMSRWLYLEDVSRHQLQVNENHAPQYRMLRPVAEAVEVKVHTSKRHQTILGWGGITSKAAFHMLNEDAKEDWWKFPYDYGFNIQREYPAGRSLKEDMSNLGSLDAAVHHTYAGNFPNGETTCFEYLRRHRQLPGSDIWYEYWWHQPEWTYGDADAYAKSIIHYSKILEEVTGEAPEVIGVQNEHRMRNWREHAPAPPRHLDAAGYQSTKIHMNDDSKITDEALNWLQEYIDTPTVQTMLQVSLDRTFMLRDWFIGIFKLSLPPQAL